ncbi:MAG TPA: response regulator transcription factor [Acidimicrobiia bacterium]|nr:response regulator transcription factor [Acidimicrobiia bacterium]
MIAAIHPEDCSEQLTDALSLTGLSLTHVRELAPENVHIRDADLLVVELGHGAIRQLREVARLEESVGIPVVLVASKEHLALIEGSGAKSEFIVAPLDPVELRIRVRRLIREESGEEILTFKDLELNPLNYQATLAGNPMDLTYMEYELLRFLVENPVRVWSREQLLSKVWGYEYYGGARTVDVHVRRLRSKLGEERASWITTVRSVGYRWG